MPGFQTAPITVIIPTRNRGHTIADTLKSCVTQDADCRFIVSDNCSDDNTEEVVRSFNDPRLEFVRTDRILSMEASFDFALARAPNGYLYTMGGDDVLCPGGIAHLQKVIAETGSLAIRPRLVNYHWDNYPDPTHQQIASNVPIGSGWQWKESEPFLQYIADNLLKHAYFYEHAPAFYHGCVHSSLLSSEWPPTAPVIRSKVPDMYSGVLIGAKVSRYVLLDTPVSLNAMSCSSNGVPQFLRQGLEKGDGHSFWAQVDYPYEPELVRQSSNPDIVLAMPLLLADQFLKVRKLGLPAPEISMEEVVTATIRGACRWRSRDQYEGALRIACETAAIHGLEDLAEKAISAHPFQERAPTRRQTTFDRTNRIYRILDLAPMGATGAYSAAAAIQNVRNIHAKQDKLRTEAGLSEGPPDVHSLVSRSDHLHLWLLVRAYAHRLKGSVLIPDCPDDSAVKAAILSAPSFALSTTVLGKETTNSDELYDCALVVDPDKNLDGLLPWVASAFILRDAKSRSSPPPGWNVTREPFVATTAELCLLFANRWLKPFARLFNKPLVMLLKSRLAGTRGATKPSKLVMEHWTRY
jgi:hypothetical protein